MVSSLPYYFTDLKYGAKVIHLKNGEIAKQSIEDHQNIQNPRLIPYIASVRF